MQCHLMNGSFPPRRNNKKPRPTTSQLLRPFTISQLLLFCLDTTVSVLTVTATNDEVEPANSTMPPKVTKSKKEAKADTKGDDDDAMKKPEESKKGDEIVAVDTAKEKDASPTADAESDAAKDKTDDTVDNKEEEKETLDEKKEESDVKEAKKDEEGETEKDDVEMKDAAKDDDAGKDSKDNAAEGSSTKKKRKKSSAKEPREPAVKRERRERKSANAFTPDDFTHVEKSVKQKNGRGKPLGELEMVKKSIESAPVASNELQQVHRLLFAMRGKPPKKEMKSNLLKFSGYLPEKDSSLDKEAQDDVDEEVEVSTSFYHILTFRKLS